MYFSLFDFYFHFSNGFLSLFKSFVQHFHFSGEMSPCLLHMIDAIINEPLQAMQSMTIYDNGSLA